MIVRALVLLCCCGTAWAQSTPATATSKPTRCQLLQERRWPELTRAVFDTSIIKEAPCGRRLRVSKLASFNLSPPNTNIGIINITLAQALADVECSGILGNLQLEMVPGSSNCDSAKGVQVFLNQLYNEDVAMAIGPECSVVAQQIGLLASYIKFPILAYSTESVTLSDKSKYGSYFRVNHPGTTAVQGWKGLLHQLSITKLTLIKEVGREFDEYVRQFENYIRNEKTINLEDVQTVSESDVNVTTVFQHILRANTKVVIAQVYPKVMRALLCQAYRKYYSCCGNSPKNQTKIIFVWPSWFTPLNWLRVSGNTDDEIPKDRGWDNCTTQQLLQAAVGSFVATAQGFKAGNGMLRFPNTTLQGDSSNQSSTGLHSPPSTVREVEERILTAYRNVSRDYTSNGDVTFAGFLYDAVWTAAYALRNYLNNSEELLSDCAVINRTIDQLKFHRSISKQEANAAFRTAFIDGFYNVNFEGVSGHVLFENGTTNRAQALGKITNVYASMTLCNTSSVTRVNDLVCDLREVGSFSENENDTLSLDVTSIEWGYGCQYRQSTCRQPTTSNLKPVVAEKNYNCGGLNDLAEKLGSCARAVVLVVVLPTICVLLLVLVVANVIFRKAYRKKYLDRSVLRLGQIGLKKNEAYDLMVPDKAWEMDRKCLEINRKLGEGAFGAVYGADYYCKNSTTCRPVAVKTLHEGADIEDKTKFFLEIQLMKKFSHTNVVAMLGVCTGEDPMYIVMELMLHGDLRGFLLGHRHLAGSTAEEGPDAVDAKRLTSMARDIAYGLQYLHSVNFIHRDLAARNCMVTTNFQVKIGDFGMARDVKMTDYYRVKAAALLPIRWMARESLLDGVFTAATDIWSFGVVLYEMITFGAMPYADKENEDVMTEIRDGHKMDLPTDCPDDLAALMYECWVQGPECRPQAAIIAETLSNKSELVRPCLSAIATRQSNPPQTRRNTLHRREMSTEQSVEQAEPDGLELMENPRYVPQPAAMPPTPEERGTSATPLSEPLPPREVNTTASLGVTYVNTGVQRHPPANGAVAAYVNTSSKDRKESQSHLISDYEDADDDSPVGVEPSAD